MKKLTEYENEDALDLLADILEPSAEILADEELKEAIRKKESKVKLVSRAIKNHKRPILEILARLEDVSVDEYHCNILTLPMKVLEVLNDKELLAFFRDQLQEIGANVSIDAMATTEETGTK